MNDTDIAWLAGIIDGEGCFSVKRPIKRGDGGRGQTCYQIWIVLCNTSPSMVDRAASIISQIGCTPPRIKRVWKGERATRYQYWVHIARKHDVLRLTEALLHHLTAKRIEALVVADFLRRACAVKAYKQTEKDKLLLASLAAVKRCGGEAPAEYMDLLSEVIPNEALLDSVRRTEGGSERVETSRLSSNDNADQECPTPVVH